MTKQIKPLLSCDIDLEDVNFPVYVSKKLDGIRCLVIDGMGFHQREFQNVKSEYERQKTIPLAFLKN